MSKAKIYFDTKTKARHRMRRQEERSKKLSRIRKYNSHIYHWYKSGYIPRPKDRQAWYIPDYECVVNGHGYLKRYGCTKILKYCKKMTARALRRNKCFDEDNYERYSRSAYKRICDLDSELW